MNCKTPSFSPTSPTTLLFFKRLQFSIPLYPQTCQAFFLFSFYCHYPNLFYLFIICSLQPILRALSALPHDYSVSPKSVALLFLPIALSLGFPSQRIGGIEDSSYLLNQCLKGCIAQALIYHEVGFSLRKWFTSIFKLVTQDLSNVFLIYYLLSHLPYYISNKFLWTSSFQ